MRGFVKTYVEWDFYHQTFVGILSSLSKVIKNGNLCEIELNNKLNYSLTVIVYFGTTRGTVLAQWTN